MKLLLTAFALALAGQVAQDGRYTQDAAPAVEQAATAPTAAGATVEAASGSPDGGASADPAGSADGRAGAADAATADGESLFDGSGSAGDPAAGDPPANEPAASSAPLTFQPPLYGEENAPTVAEPPAQAPPESSVLAAQGPKPSEVMQELMQAPAAGRLSGVEITLGEAVRDARSRQDQTQRAQAYWDLSTAVGEHYLALLEQHELAILRQGLPAPGEHWNVHEQQARTRVESTRRAANAAQLQLHQLVGRPAAAPLPLPGDLPHCGRYNAEYEEIFARRPDPVARELSALMPLRYAELRAQAAALAEAEAWRNEARQHWTSAADDHKLLNAQDLVSLKRRAFLATARDYNQEIAAYTELAAPAEVAPDRLVAMMIRTSSSGLPGRRSSRDVEPASATDAGNGASVMPAGGAAADAQTPTRGEAPQTFAEQNRTEARRPIRGVFNNAEHSILSRIRRLPQRILDRD